MALRNTWKWLMPVLALLLVGCQPEELLSQAMHRMAPDEDETLAQQCLEELRMRNYEPILRLTGSEILRPGLATNLVLMADAMDHGTPMAVELVGCNIVFMPPKRFSNLTYQYQFSNAWVLADITLVTQNEQPTIQALHINPIPKSLRELNAFTFKNKQAQHYLMTLFALAIPIFILIALIVCLRTRGLRRKWLWILFIVWGFGKVSLNWTTGQVLFNPLELNVQLGGAGLFAQGLYAPWVLSVSFPLGALLFLFRSLKPAATPPPLNREEPRVTASEPPARPTSAPQDW